MINGAQIGTKKFDDFRIGKSVLGKVVSTKDYGVILEV